MSDQDWPDRVEPGELHQSEPKQQKQCKHANEVAWYWQRGRGGDPTASQVKGPLPDQLHCNQRNLGEPVRAEPTTHAHIADTGNENRLRCCLHGIPQASFELKTVAFAR